MKVGNPYAVSVPFRATSSAVGTIVLSLPIYDRVYRLLALYASLEPEVTAGNFSLMLAADIATTGTYQDIFTSAKALTHNATYANRVKISLDQTAFRTSLTSANNALILPGKMVKLYVSAQTTAIAGGGYSGVLILA